MWVIPKKQVKIHKRYKNTTRKLCRYEEWYRIFQVQSLNLYLKCLRWQTRVKGEKEESIPSWCDYEKIREKKKKKKKI